MESVTLIVEAAQDSRYSTPIAMKEIDDHLATSTPARFVCEAELPLQREDGRWIVTVATKERLPIVRSKLSHFGLTVIEEIPDTQQPAS